MPTRATIQLIIGTIAALNVSAALADERPHAFDFGEHAKPVLSMYCTHCHGQESSEAELDLESLSQDAPDLLKHHEIWIRVAEMVTSGEMPPEDEPQPTGEERSQFLGWLESGLAAIDCRIISQPGIVPIHRLNRTEYNNTIRDLVGVKFRPADDFPADDVGNGFDNIAQVLSLPPLLMEKYLDAAEQIVTAALSDEALRKSIIHRWPAIDDQRTDCARDVLERFARRAFRRPTSPREIDLLMNLANQSEQAGLDYVESLSIPLQAILVSPHFLFRIELDDESGGPPGPRPLNDHELASRLSYFLWSSMPDDTLMQIADRGELGNERALTEQARRLLSDSKAEAFVSNFVGQWLELRNLTKVAPDPDVYPAFNNDLREAMRSETETFFRSLIEHDRSVLDLIDADYTYLNESLARFYGVKGVSGDAFREVKLTDERRGGILTQASILTLTSNPTRTSPVKRGKWILDNMLGAPPPPPPAGVEELAEGDKAELLGTLRERMAQHRTDPSCSVCHRKMDALGFGFENFDGIGAWRDRDGRFEIDASGELPGNQRFQGPAELRDILKSTGRKQFARCLAEKTLTYALGRGLESYDRCTVDEIVDSLARNEYHFSALVDAIVTSEAFRMRGLKGEGK